MLNICSSLNIRMTRRMYLSTIPLFYTKNVYAHDVYILSNKSITIKHNHYENLLKHFLELERRREDVEKRIIKNPESLTMIENV